MIEAELRVELEQLLQAGSLREVAVATAITGRTIEHRGKKLIDFTSGDFLGLKAHREVKKSVHTAIEQLGISSSSPRLISGSTVEHQRCELRLAQFFGFESALLFSSKNQAVLSWVTACSNERDLFLVDELVQSPIVDAAYLVGANVESFKDLTELAAVLEKNKFSRRKFIVIEGVSALTGSVVDVASISAIAKRFGAMIVVDESYALGTVGVRGAGLSELIVQLTHEPASQHLFLIFADLSLAIGSYGAAVMSSKIVISYLVNRSRVLAVETPLPPALCAGIITAVDLLEIKILEREKIAAKAARMAQSVPLNLLMPRDAHSAIVTLHYSKYKKAYEIWQVLVQRGILAELFPVVTALSQAALIRFQVTSEHTDQQIDEVTRVLGELLLTAERRG